MFVAHLHDDEKTAGIGMVNILTNSMPVALCYGISGVLETLVSQAYSNEKYYLCGQYLNKMIFVMSVAFVPIGCLLWNATPLL